VYTILLVKIIRDNQASQSTIQNPPNQLISPAKRTQHTNNIVGESTTSKVGHKKKIQPTLYAIAKSLQITFIPK
jgi:hypothetical protein